MISATATRRLSNTLPVEPLWLSYERLLTIHGIQIERFRGVPGVKDRNLVESALSNPRNLFHYDDVDDLLTLAVRLCYAIAKNHGFNDGNKRAAFAGMGVFLELNGFTIAINDDTLAGRMVEGLIDGSISEEEFADDIAPWIVCLG